MSKFKPDYSHRTDYTTEYPFNSVTFPSGAPVLGEDLNELQDIQNYKRDSFNAAMYTDGYIHTSHIYVMPNTTDYKLYIDGYVLISGELYRIEFSRDLDNYDLDSLYIYAVVTTDKEYTESSKIKGLTNYLSANDFGEEVSRRKGYSISATITKTPTEFPGQKSLLLMMFSNGKLAYMTPAPTPKNLSQNDALLDMRTGKTFKCYDADVKSFEYHFEDNGTFYYVIDNGKTTNNISLYRSNNLINWEQFYAPIYTTVNGYNVRFDVSHTKVVNGRIFLFATEAYSGDSGKIIYGKYGYVFVYANDENNWNISRLERKEENIWNKPMFLSAQVVPAGDNDASIIYVAWENEGLGAPSFQVKVARFNADEGIWVAERLPYEAIPNGLDYKEPRIGKYTVTSSKDAFIVVSNLAFSPNNYTYSFILSFTHDSGRLTYNKHIVIDRAYKNDSQDINHINVAGAFYKCRDSSRSISFDGNDGMTSSYKRINFWCSADEGHTFELDENGYLSRKANGDIDDYLGVFDCNGTDTYAMADLKNPGWEQEVVLARGLYFYINRSWERVEIYQANSSCRFIAAANILYYADSFLLKPVYSNFYNGIIFICDGKYGYTTFVVDGNGELIAPNTTPPGKNSFFLTDRKGQAYAMWRNNDIALPKYYISSLSRDLVWSESREIAVNKCEELKPFYADHAIYFENDGDIYISGEIK